MTRVKAAEERSEIWEEEVFDRVTALTEASPIKRVKLSPRSRSHTSSPPASPVAPSLPPTQPLGESILAGMYVREATPPKSDVQSSPPHTPGRSPLRPTSVSPLRRTESISAVTLQALPMTDTSILVQLTPPQPSQILPKSPDPEPLSLPPISQKRRGRFKVEALSPSSQKILGLGEPFRGRGSPRAEGGFPGKRGLADWGEGGELGKRGRIEAGAVSAY